MKRWIRCTFDPETNPRNAAEATIKQLNSDLTAIGNVVKGCQKQFDKYTDDDNVMNQIVDKLSYMQKEVDKIREHYNLNK